MLITLIQEKEGGFNRLDLVIRDFRIGQLPDEVQLALAELQNAEVLHA